MAPMLSCSSVFHVRFASYREEIDWRYIMLIASTMFLYQLFVYIFWTFFWFGVLFWSMKVFSLTTAGELLLLACVILVGLFALQHSGTHRVAFMFAPIVIIWLFSILFIGFYNIIHWNPKIIYAVSPLYIIKFFRMTGQDGWISLGGVLLSVTGTSGSGSRHNHKIFLFFWIIYFLIWADSLNWLSLSHQALKLCFQILAISPRSQSE